MWSNLNQAVEEQSDKNIPEALQRLKLFLNTDVRCNVIRLHIDTTPGTGHQFSSIHLLRRLLAPESSNYKGWGFRNIVEVYYTDVAGKTLKLLHDLLPELDGKNEGQL